MRRTWSRTIQVAVGMVPVTATMLTPQGYVGSWVDCFAQWTPIAPKVGADVIFEWGDGQQDRINNIHDPPSFTESHNYQTAGTFTIRVTVIDQYNNKGETTTTVQIVDQLEGFLNADPMSGNPPLTVTFTMGMDKGFGPYDWTLTTGDGGSYSGSDPSGVYTRTHEYVSAGSFSAVLTVTDQLGVFISAEAKVGIGMPALPISSLVLPLGIGFAGLAAIYLATRR